MIKKAINGLSVFLEGKLDARPVLFIHGFPYDHSMWKAQVDDLYRDHLCVSYDIRGLGESPSGDGQFTMESLVDDLGTIIGELRLNRPLLCGLSMGGYIALRSLEKMPDSFSAVILCDTRSEADDNEGKLKRASAIQRINAEGLAPYARDFMATCFSGRYKENHQDEFRNIVKRSSRFDPLGVKGCLIAMLSRTDTTASLARMSIPALVICGEEDALTPPAAMRRMAQHIAGAEFAEIKGAGHMSPLENPDDVNRAIRQFLRKPSGAPARRKMGGDPERMTGSNPHGPGQHPIDRHGELNDAET